MMNRREFAAKAAATVGVLGCFPAAVGCWVGNLYSDILQYSPVALAALQSVLSILAANGISTDSTVIGAAIMLYKSGLADVQAAVTQYENAPQGQKSTLLLAISEALTVAEANINQFWNSLTIPDPKLESLIEGLLGVVTTTLAGFASQLPAATSPKASAVRAMTRRQVRTLNSTPTRRSVKQVRHDFNALLANAGESKHAI